MSTTKTRPSEQLQELITARDEALIAKREVRAERDGYNAETEAQRAAYSAASHAHTEKYRDVTTPPPDAELRKMGEAIQARMAGENPHAADYRKASEAFDQADRKMQQFRIDNLPELLAETDAEVVALDHEIRGAFERIAESVARYEGIVARGSGLTAETPRLNGQHLGIDTRVAGWGLTARIALEDDDPVMPPQLNHSGLYELSQVRDDNPFSDEAK